MSPKPSAISHQLSAEAGLLTALRACGSDAGRSLRSSALLSVVGFPLLLLGFWLLAPPARAQNTLAGNLTVQQTVKLTGDLTPAQITADQHDYAPTGHATAAILRLSSDASRTITGLAGGAEGRVVLLLNVGAQALVLANESASSTAANRFALGSAQTLGAGDGALLVYDAVSSRWRLGARGAPAGAGSGTVTSLTAGNLAPLFTTSVADASTTPALTFALSNASANTLLAGPTSGAAASPAYRALVAADIPSLTLAKISDAGTMAAATAANYSTTAAINAWFADPSTNGSFAASAWRADLLVPPFESVDPGAADIFPKWDDTLNQVDWLPASNFRTALGVRIGVDVQAWDADLTTWAGISPSADVQTLLGAANNASFRTLVGLGNVTNHAQTQAAVVPNTAPAAGQILVGNAGGTAYAPATLGGDATVNSSGVLTLAANSVALGTDTTGAYVATIADAGSGRLTVSGSGVETAAVTLDLANTAVTPGSYGSATQAGTFTVDAQGRLTAASNATVTPAVGSITGLGTGVAPWLATPSSANLRTALTDETGAGAAVFADSPALTGTPTAPTAADNTNTTQIATTAFVRTAVDAATQALDIKASVRAIATGNITLSGAQTIDGVSVVAGDRVLVAGQSTASQNGIYVAAAGAWTRATDADTSADVTSGLFTFISEGTAYASMGFVLTTPEPIILGTTGLAFTQFSGAGQIIAGTGLTKTGNTLSTANIPNASLTNSSITIAGTAVSLGGSITLDTITGLSSTGLVKRTAANTLAIAVAATDYVAPSAYASANGLTMATARLLGRTTASTGAAEEISVGGNLSLSAGVLNLSSSYAGQSTITTVGALNSGSITSGFGSIDIGTDALTAGAATFAGTVSSTTGAGVQNQLSLEQTGTALWWLRVPASVNRLDIGQGAGAGTAYLSVTTTGLNNTVIGATTPAAASFTTLAASGQFTANGAFAIRGSTFPSSGVGLEIVYTAGVNASEIQSYDRTGAAWKGINYGASAHTFNVSGSTVTAISSTGLYVTGSGSFSNGVSITGSLNGFDMLTLVQSSSNSVGLRIQNSFAGSNNWNISSSGGGPSANGDFVVYDDTGGAVAMVITKTNRYLRALGVYNQTTASAANVFVDSSGNIMRSTSSLRYKDLLGDYDRGLADALKLRPVYFTDKGGGPRHTGFVAEEVHAAGLTEFVSYDQDGRPDALAYPHITALAIAGLHDVDAQLKSLRARVRALERN